MIIFIAIQCGDPAELVNKLNISVSDNSDKTLKFLNIVGTTAYLGYE